MPKKPKLTIELIPSTCHFSNVRTTVTSAEWDKIRFLSYEKAKNKCEICGDTGKNQGYKHNVECHEIWHYDDENHIQKLTGLISLCPTCHQVKHMGRAIAIGKQLPCMIQLAKVNKWTKEEVVNYINMCFIIHKERSKYQWSLDISILEKAPYNIKLKPMENRIFEVKKYKKKPKAKSIPGSKGLKINKLPKKTTSKAAPKTTAKPKNKKPPKK